jgi:hypothetical protein
MTKLKQHFLPNVGKWPSISNIKLSQESFFMIAQYPHLFLICGLIQQLPRHVVEEKKALVFEIGVQSILAYVMLKQHIKLYDLHLQYVPSYHNLLISIYIH